MYVPPHFRPRHPDQILELIGRYPLATVISAQADQIFASHVPLVLQRVGETPYLIGHLARANPHWQQMRGTPITAVFQGPQAYITPAWYAENSVPTWNYAVVHFKGRVELIEDEAGVLDCLQLLTTHAEAGADQPWPFWVPEDLREAGHLTQAIVGFRIAIEDVKAKFKLSQNRTEADRLSVVQGLSARGAGMDQALADLMLR